MVKTLCTAPWRGLHINFRGDVKTCCAGNPNMLGNLNSHSLDEILHGNKIIEIRNTIKNGSLHAEYCENCIKAERYGRSERHWHNDVNQDFDVTLALANDYKPSIVDVRWNITCNLSCNYCGPYCSSKWASKMKFQYRSGARPYYEQVCDFLDKHRSNIKEVALVGGEPLLLPENERLLDVIPKDCIVTIITNMSVDFNINPIVAKLRQRQRVGWSMSFDNVGERFEYVRSGSKWALLQKNVDMVRVWMQELGHWGGVHSVYNIYNCTRLTELKEFTDLMGLAIQWQPLHNPEFLDPVLHNKDVRQLAVEQIHLYMKSYHCDQVEKDFFSNVIARFENYAPSSAKNQFIDHINQIETKYHVRDRGKFKILWPELSNIIFNE